VVGRRKRCDDVALQEQDKLTWLEWSDVAQALLGPVTQTAPTDQEVRSISAFFVGTPIISLPTLDELAMLSGWLPTLEEGFSHPAKVGSTRVVLGSLNPG
jgi:hypothetical protein